MNSYTTIQKDQLSKIGAHLKESREQQEKSIEEISLQTYIRPQLIRAIESGNTEDLPQPIFVQGFIRRYAEALGLEGLTLSKQFPVHSIPDTPRPNPIPAAKPSMFSSAAMANPVVVAPKPLTKPPTQTATVSMSTVTPTSKPNSAAPAAPAVTNGSDQSASSDRLRPEPVIPNTTAAEPATVASAAPPSPPTPPAPRPVEPAATWPPSPSTRSTSSSASTVVPYVVAGILAAIVVGAIAWISSLGNNQNTQEAEAPTTPEPSAEVAAAPEPEPTPTPEAPISEAPVYLQVEVTEAGPSWMRINVDGKVAYEGMVNAGEKKLWEGQNQISVNVGNAGAAMLSVNGSDPEPAGNPGAATVLTFTPDSQ